MANGTLDRYRPLFLLVGSLATASLLLYAAVFALSFWSIVFSLAGFRAEAFAHLRLTSMSFRN